MPVLPFSLEFLLVALALAAALSVRPWRMLAPAHGAEPAGPLVAVALALPLLWWQPMAPVGPLFWLLGAQLALLAVGWPLAVLAFAWAGALGWVTGAASAEGALAAIAWQGVLPATVGLGAGHLLRRTLGAHPFVYLLGRGFLVPLAATFACAVAAWAWGDRYQSLGTDTVPLLVVAALLDAMLTGSIVTLLVAQHPAWLATWSDRLYLRRPARRG